MPGDPAAGHWVEPNDSTRHGRHPAGRHHRQSPYDPRCDTCSTTTPRTCRVCLTKACFATPSPPQCLRLFSRRFRRDYDELVYWADRIDSADFTRTRFVPSKIRLRAAVHDVSGNMAKKRLLEQLVRLLRRRTSAVMADPTSRRAAGKSLRTTASTPLAQEYTRVEGLVPSRTSVLGHRLRNRFLSYSFP